jgi:hypothetical protein
MVKQAKLRKRDRLDAFDQVWCVFDVEYGADQPARYGLDEAIDNARRNQIATAVSNPCFEFWLLIHQEVVSAPLSRDQACRRCSELRVISGKVLCNSKELIAKSNQAKQHAQELEMKHIREGKERPEDMIPSSGMYKLIDAIHAAFPPRV